MIATGQQALASDFVSASAGAGSNGQVPKLNGSGKLDNSFLPIKFGGSGADGVLSITSGVTTISAANASILIKNYSSISITGTGKLVFNNPNANGTIIVLKSQGNVTLTSSMAPMIDASSMGAAGGNGAAVRNGAQSGGVGSVGSSFASVKPPNGGGGGNPNGGGASSGGSSISAPTSVSGYYSVNSFIGLQRYPQAFTGAGGGGGSTFEGNNQATIYAGTGGIGGGGLIIECAGAWNFTTTNGISVSGGNGGNGTVAGSAYAVATGGGGGGGGFFLALYNSLTANSGSVNSGGGGGGGNASAGNPGNAGYSAGGGGGGYASGSGSPTGQYSGSAPAGGAGIAVITLNTEFI